MIAAAAIFLVIFFLAVAAYGKRKKSLKEYDKKEHPLRALYPLAEIIFDRLRRKGNKELFGTEEQIKEIYINQDPDKAGRHQALRCIAASIAIIMGTCLIVFLYKYTETTQLMDGRMLKRNPSGDGSRDYELTYLREKSEEAQNKRVSVNEIILKGEELEQLKNQSVTFLDKAVLGGNTSAESITGKLYLPDKIPETSVQVEWNQDMSWMVASDGTLKNDDLESPVKLLLQADLSYYGENWRFEKNVTVMPKEYSEEEIFDRNLEMLLKESDGRSGSEEYYILPSEVDGEKLQWNEKNDETAAIIMVLGIVSAFAMVPMLKQELKKKQENRKKQMLSDYPDIVSKLALLLTAGMTCQAAWSKICADYEKEKEKDGIEKNCFRYAYEEMLVSYRELCLGEPEIRVYEKFGTRCHVAEYRRMSTILARNLKRGNAGIVGLLENEATDAFEERKAEARRRGEETGTKLLLPMFGMLIIVFVIVIVPAFSNL